MAISAKFGPNTAAVSAFLESVKNVPWFSQVGQPTERDGELTRVEFDFLAKHHGAPYSPWGAVLASNENRIERLVFDSQRLGEWGAIRKLVKFPLSGWTNSTLP